MMARFNMVLRCMLAAALLAFLCNGNFAFAQTQTQTQTQAKQQTEAARTAPAASDGTQRVIQPDDPPQDTWNDAAFNSQSVPTTMTAGSVYTVTVRMLNSGTTTWYSGTAYALGSRNPFDNGTWGGSRVALPGPVTPGHIATFTFNVTAPAAAGSYNFQWAMVQDGVEWFGPPSDNVVINVVAAPRNGSQFVTQSVPASMTTGAQYPVSLTFSNTGNTTWDPTNGKYVLLAVNPVNNETWVYSRIPLSGPVAPGQQTTVAWTTRAPSTPGTYNFQWIILQEGVELIGTPSNNVAVVVSAPAPVNGAHVLSFLVSPMTQGQNATVTVTLQNTGGTTWSVGSNYKLGSQNPGENLTWGVQRIDLASDVAPGQSYTFAFPITAPAAGTYTMQWQMMQRYVEWFGGVASAPVTVNPPPSGDTVTYIHTDALGSPVARSDSGGNVISRTSYEPYGRTAGGVTPTIGFTGHVNDADTGLVYMQQRYYDPVAGRFLSVDPVTTDASTGDSFNRYQYAQNNPYKYIDPDGRIAILVPIVAGAFIGGGINLGAQLWKSEGNFDKVSWGQVGVAATAGALAGGAGIIASTAATTGGMVGANAVAGAAISAGGAHAAAVVDGKSATTGDVLYAAGLGSVASAAGGAVVAVAAKMAPRVIDGAIGSVGNKNIVEGIKNTTNSAGGKVSYVAAGQAVANRASDAVGNSPNVEQKPKDK